MPILERSGESIAYDVTGAGPPVVLGHSLLCGRWMWKDVVPKLAEQYTVYNVEFRGHGESTATTEFSFADLVDDWLALLDHHGISKAAFVGLSMGGMTAMRLALAAQERAAALVLFDTSADVEPRLRQIKYAGMKFVYRHFGFRNVLVKQTAPIMLCRDTIASRPELVDELARGMREHDREPLLRVIRAVLGRRDRPAVEDIACPTLIAVGEHDAATVPARSRDLERRIPGARLVVIPGAGHLSAMEQPDRVAAETLEFLGAHSW